MLLIANLEAYRQPPNGVHLAALGITEEGNRLSMCSLSCERIPVPVAEISAPVAEISAPESGKTAVVMAPLRVMILTCSLGAGSVDVT